MVDTPDRKPDIVFYLRSGPKMDHKEEIWVKEKILAIGGSYGMGGYYDVISFTEITEDMVKEETYKKYLDFIAEQALLGE